VGVWSEVAGASGVSGVGGGRAATQPSTAAGACPPDPGMQALLHSPLLRNHYLLERHPPSRCGLAAAGGHCVSCELVSLRCCGGASRRCAACTCSQLDAAAALTQLPWNRAAQDGLFSAVYSGRRAALSPARFLYAWWQLAGGCAPRPGSCACRCVCLLQLPAVAQPMLVQLIPRGTALDTGS
jgi:hypothetical protein